MKVIMIQGRNFSGRNSRIGVQICKLIGFAVFFLLVITWDMYKAQLNPTIVEALGLVRFSFVGLPMWSIQAGLVFNIVGLAMFLSFIFSRRRFFARLWEVIEIETRELKHEQTADAFVSPCEKLLI